MNLREWLGSPVSGASLALFRIGFGAVQIFQTWEFVRPISDGSMGTLEYLYTGKHVAWNFPYPNFEWVAPLPEPLTSIAFAILALSSLTLMLGLATPISAILNGLLFTYAWMLESTWWNNHYYLSSLVALMLALTPCSRCFSLDRWLFTRRTGTGTQTDGVIPFWPIWWFRAQLYVVYTYAAVVKMNPDWFMGEPPRLWFRSQLAAQPLSWVIGPDTMKTFFALFSSEPVVYLFVWGGLVFDLVIGLLLCVRRTQVLGLVLMFMFHGTNFWVFMIGAFPVMAISSTLIFLDADWPLRFWAWLKRPTFRAPDPGWMLLGMLVVPLVGAVLGWKIPKTDPPKAPFFAVGRFVPIALFLWMAVQTLLPLRHLIIPGDVHWTLEGSRFGWQVMARVHVGLIRYRLQDPTWNSRPPQELGDWPPLDGAPADHLYVDTDFASITPKSLPPLVVVWEPWVRERIFFNPDAESLNDPAAIRGPEDSAVIRRRIDNLWKERFGRSPTAVERSLSLEEALTNFENKLNAGKPFLNQSTLTAAIGKLRGHAQDLASLPEDDPFFIEKALDLQLQINGIRQLAQRLGKQNELLTWLVQVQPFAMQRGKGLPWFQIVDRDLTANDIEQADATRIRWDRWKGDPKVYLDLHLIPFQAMQTLPRYMYGFDRNGSPSMHWNVERDLVPMQVDFHSSTGLMIHQYANGRIARFWTEKTGRRPHVYVDSFSKLNQHPMQRLIDPTTDLAAVPLHIWTHNDWILPPTFRTLIYHEKGQPRMRTIRLADEKTQ